MIVGRTEEVDVLDGLVADVLPEPRALLIEGEPGIGKTTLLQELLSIARERDYAILVVPADPVRDGPFVRRRGGVAGRHR